MDNIEQIVNSEIAPTVESNPQQPYEEPRDYKGSALKGVQVFTPIAYGYFPLGTKGKGRIEDFVSKSLQAIRMAIDNLDHNAGRKESGIVITEGKKTILPITPENCYLKWAEDGMTRHYKLSNVPELKTTIAGKRETSFASVMAGVEFEISPDLDDEPFELPQVKKRGRLKKGPLEHANGNGASESLAR